MAYLFPFGQELHPLIQQDQTEKKVFVLGVYASAVHAKWKNGSKIISQALAVASEPRIFWDGNPEEAWAIIKKIKIPPEVGYLEPASRQLNGPSAKVLDDDILAQLGYSRETAWLCDMLPETRLNPNQVKVIREKYNPIAEQHHLNAVTIPMRPETFCDEKRCEEITDELLRSKADTLVLLGDLPIKQYLNKVAQVDFSSLGEHVEKYGYGHPTPATIKGKVLTVIPLAHPRQIGALGAHSERWFNEHMKWEKSIR